MKTNILKLRYRKLLIYCFILGQLVAINAIQAQEFKTMKVSKVFKEKPNVTIQMFDTHTEVTQTQDSKISVQVEYVASGDNPEALKKIEQAMREYLIVDSDNSFTISNSFFSTIIKGSFFGFTSQAYIKFKDGSEYKITDFKFEVKNVKICLPTSVDLKVDSKYGSMDILLPISGTVKLETYDLILKGKTITGNLTVDGKYSKYRFEKAGDVDLSIYESDFDVTEMGKCKIDSKYSNINAINSGLLTYAGYEDKLAIQQIPGADIEAKYSHIRFLNANTIKANLYEGSMTIKKNESCSVYGKYVQFQFGQTGNLNIVDGYENHFEIEEITGLTSTNGKYNDFKIVSFLGSMVVNGYEESVQIEKVSDSFSTISVDGKYLKIKLQLNKETNYRIKGTIQYPQLSLNRNDYKVVLHDKETDLLKFEYIYGKAENPDKTIKLNGYDVSVDVLNM